MELQDYLSHTFRCQPWEYALESIGHVFVRDVAQHFSAIQILHDNKVFDPSLLSVEFGQCMSECEASDALAFGGSKYLRKKGPVSLSVNMC